MSDLERIVRETPDIEVDKDIADFLYWLDTSDHWGFELWGTMHHKLENTFAPKLKTINNDPDKLKVYTKLKEMSYKDLDIIIINWVGKEDILRGLEW